MRIGASRGIWCVVATGTAIWTTTAHANGPPSDLPKWCAGIDGKETNRVDRIDILGKVVYRKNCTVTGTKSHVLKEAPVFVEKRFTGALKAGRFIEMRVTEADRVAMPLTVYTSKDQKQLAGYLGFVL
jgi:hypothetical protein